MGRQGGTAAKGAADAPADGEPQTLSTKDKISRATYPTRTVDICLETDLQAEYEALHEELRQAVVRESGDRRLNPGGESKRIAEQIEALQQQMAEYVIRFRLQALGSRGWDKLSKAHPPREGEKDDAALGYNPDTFFDAAIRACTVDPSDLDDDDWTALLGDDDVDGKLTAKQYNDLHDAVLALNVRKISVPNSFAASRILRPSEPE
ncbi:hypothetical protein O7626_40080 [Micromonospora sp. WMMD1102]|uniref:hypothetical protein n=1 Tax=Micromonospora sp. WMMD1102 TaxID=3016105 RepID=UPI0024159278|nr:hypothetical protein [Micromonospora sp. WMMD1102]MDG4792016.1 hypothetical protein [Micromonospora sp. WMMD1102]